jgi:hypothetical protein
MFMSQFKNNRQYFNTRIDSKALQNVANFKYLEKAVTNQNYIQDESKVGLNLDIHGTFEFRIFIFLTPL